MLQRWRTSWVPVLMMLLSCGSVLPSAPAWFPSTVRRPAGHYVGEAGPASAPAHAREGAVASAVAALAQELGVHVGSTVLKQGRSSEAGAEETIEVETRLESVPVVVRGLSVVREHLVPGPGGYHAWVEVAVPAAERARLSRVALGRTWLTVRCDLDGQRSCPPGAVERVRAAVASAGLRLAEGDPLAPTDATQARATGAAFLLRLDLESRFRSRSGDEHYADATAHLALVDTADAKGLAELAVGPLKGGDYTREKAVLAAAEVALRGIVEAVAAHGLSPAAAPPREVER